MKFLKWTSTKLKNIPLIGKEALIADYYIQFEAFYYVKADLAFLASLKEEFIGLTTSRKNKTDEKIRNQITSRT